MDSSTLPVSLAWFVSFGSLKERSLLLGKPGFPSSYIYKLPNSIGASPEEAYEDDKGSREPPIQRQAENTGTVQPGEEERYEDLRAASTI